jgi:xylose isomerase
VKHADAAGFEGVFLIEPKPREPSAHQYDFDAATTLGSCASSACSMLHAESS